ncbi:MAG: DUF4932 domain-containing protein [Armatimonadota bacterium]
MPLVVLSILGTLVQHSIPVQVNPRVELLSIIFRLAEADEYSMAPADAPYVKRVDSHFGKYKDHPAVKYALKVREESGIGFDAVASFAVHLRTDNFAFKMADSDLRKSLSSRWKLDDAKAFAKLLEQFTKATDANGFFASEAKFYRQAAESLSHELAKYPYSAWFDGMFGVRKNAPFSAIPGLLNGGANYGMTVTYPRARMEILPILGTVYDSTGLPVYDSDDRARVVHEFCHTYTNGYVDATWDSFGDSAERIFPSRKAILADQAYGSAKVMIQESLVRAMTVKFAQERMSSSEAKEALAAEHRRGFFWTKRLVDLIDQFQSERKQYPKFKDFMPRVAEFFRREAADLETNLAKIPKIESTSIRAGETVSPGVNILKVKFDRPMIAGRKGLIGATLTPWPDGSSGGHWSPDGTSVEFNLKLEPNKAYRYQFGNMYGESYESKEGFPFEPAILEFKTSDLS